MKRQLILLAAFILLLVSPSCDCGGKQLVRGKVPGAPSVELKDLGEPCSQGSECKSGVCRQNVCSVVQSTTCTVKNSCGTCDNNSCKEFGVGGGGAALDVSNNDIQNAKDVIVATENGKPAITVAIEKNDANYIWIALTQAGQIAKINSKDFDEVARYWTGPNGTSNDPSRTSINSFGDAYVANRHAKTVTKIAGNIEECIDRNNNGKIDTSTGPSDVKNWNEDECVLWNTSLDGGRIRALAAQDYNPVTQKREPVVWAGSYDAKKIYKIDGESGNILFDKGIGVDTYGFAFDRQGNLWIATLTNQIARIDTKRCLDEASCTNAGVQGCTSGEEDECVIMKIPTQQYTYGITVDKDQNVWVAGGQICSYKPNESKGSRLNCKSIGDQTAGIQADDKGFIWAGANNGTKMYRMDAAQMDFFTKLDTAVARGVAVDLEGKVWGIPNSGTPGVSVVTPGKDLFSNSIQTGIATGVVNAYTYSDMTGSQLRFSGAKSGTYTRIFEGCAFPQTGGTNWLKLEWEADMPEPSSIVFRVRGAANKLALAAATWEDIAHAPTDKSPFDLKKFLEQHGLSDSQVIQVQAELRTGRRDDDKKTFIVPKLFSMKVVAECRPAITG